MFSQSVYSPFSHTDFVPGTVMGAEIPRCPEGETGGFSLVYR